MGKKVTIDIEDGNARVRDDAAAQPGQLVQVPLTGPVANHTLVTGAVIQADFNTVAVAVEARYKQIAQKNIEQATKDRAAAVKVMGEKDAALKKAVAQLQIPNDFVADAEALAKAFEKFYTTAVVTGVGTRTALRDVRPTPNATAPVAGLVVYHDQDRMAVAAEVRADGDRVTTVTRDYPVPADVTAARKELVEAQAAVARLDARLVELAKEKQTATERGRTGAAAAALAAMAKMEGGGELIDRIVAATNAQAAAAGLEVPTDGNDILALAAKQPDRPAARPTAQ